MTSSLNISVWALTSLKIEKELAAFELDAGITYLDFEPPDCAEFVPEPEPFARGDLLKKDQIIDIARRDPDRLSPTVAAAVIRLAEGRTARSREAFTYRKLSATLSKSRFSPTWKSYAAIY